MITISESSSRYDTKAILSEPADQTGLSSRMEFIVSLRLSEPSGRIQYISGFPSISETNTILLPFGDHAISFSSASLLVNRRASSPSEFIT